jgi:hypothetical protein
MDDAITMRMTSLALRASIAVFVALSPIACATTFFRGFGRQAAETGNAGARRSNTRPPRATVSEPM